MKFKIEKGTGLFEAFLVLKERIRITNAQAFEVVEELGLTRYCPELYCLAGGISAFVIDDFTQFKRKNWAAINARKYSNFFFPKKIKANEALLAKIKALPKLQYNELNDLIQFKAGSTTILGWALHPGVIWRDDFVLIDTTEGQIYEPVADMIEILESEYIRLKNATPSV